MWNLCLMLTKWIVIVFLIKGITCIKLVSLNVPARVKKGSEVELSCLYDLGNASLYSLKWFYRANDWERDEQEFFRYTPRGKPAKQVFPLDGIKVDYNKSEGGTVIISETSGKTSGKYKCEISVEGTFQTVAAEKLMTVEANRASLVSSSLDNKLMFILLIASHYTTQFFIISTSAAESSIKALIDIKLGFLYQSYRLS